MKRTLRPLASLAMIAIISAACSTAYAQTTTDNGGSANPATHEQAVEFAACMRANGIGAFPDPAASGTFTVDGVLNGSSLDPESAAWKNAIGACKELQPAGFMGARRNAQEQESALKFAACIRENGVNDFPDPAPDAPLVDTNTIPSASGSSGMSALNAAMHTCRSFVADLVTAR